MREHKPTSKRRQRETTRRGSSCKSPHALPSTYAHPIHCSITEFLCETEVTLPAFTHGLFGLDTAQKKPTAFSAFPSSVLFF